MIYLTIAGSHPGVDVYLLFSNPVLVNTHSSWECLILWVWGGGCLHWGRLLEGSDNYQNDGSTVLRIMA